MKTRYLLLWATLLLQIQLQGQIVINEIRASDSNVELKNIGGSTVNVGTYWLCQFPTYNQLSNLSPSVCGDLNLAVGATLTVDLTYDLDGSDGELGLYLNADFGNTASIIDYVEWGSAGHTRSIVAQGALIWSTNSFVPSWDDCGSLEYDGTGNSPADWLPQNEPTMPCIENALDGCALMPLSLLAFDVRGTKEGALISWKAVYDITISEMYLEHSSNLKNWEILTRWSPEGPEFVAGTFLHSEPASGSHYYRLMTRYLDGMEESSRMLFLRTGDEEDKVRISPNPSVGIIDVSIPNADPSLPYAIRLVDAKGNLCQQKEGIQVRFNLHGLPGGVYVVEIPVLGVSQRVIYAAD